MAKEPQIAYRFIVGNESVANATNHSSHTKVYTPIIHYAGGGSLSTTRERMREAVKSPNKWKDFQKEQNMCKILAKEHGFEIVHRQGNGEYGNTYDITINGVKADLKRTEGYGNIYKYAKHAIKEQGASITIFQFDIDVPELHTAIANLTSRGYHGYYFFTGREKRLHSY